MFAINIFDNQVNPISFINFTFFGNEIFNCIFNLFFHILLVNFNYRSFDLYDDKKCFFSKFSYKK